jgi:hypothetical protein
MLTGMISLLMVGRHQKKGHNNIVMGIRVNECF